MSHEPMRELPPDERRSIDRLVFFSDAVFAIAMTLLVIDLRVPEAATTVTDADLRVALGELMPKVLAFVLSFAVIGLYWLAHWRRFRYIERVDDRLALINLLLLGTIAFIPFPTSLLGEQGDLPTAVVIYAVSLSLAGVLGTATWLYAVRTGLTRAGIDDRMVRIAAMRGLSVPIVMLSSLLLLPIAGPGVVTASWVLILVVQVLGSRFVARR